MSNALFHPVQHRRKMTQKAGHGSTRRERGWLRRQDSKLLTKCEVLQGQGHGGTENSNLTQREAPEYDGQQLPVHKGRVGVCYSTEFPLDLCVDRSGIWPLRARSF